MGILKGKEVDCLCNLCHQPFSEGTFLSRLHTFNKLRNRVTPELSRLKHNRSQTVIIVHVAGTSFHPNDKFQRPAIFPVANQTTVLKASWQ